MINRDNWFLVVPTVILGVVASVTLYRMHAAGDVRRALEVVTEYRAEGRPPLGEFVTANARPAEWDAEVVSSFYGTMDVTCRVQGEEPVTYRWRVDVIQKAFAPADETTRELMRRYEPALYGSTGEDGGASRHDGGGAEGDDDEETATDGERGRDGAEERGR